MIPKTQFLKMGVTDLILEILALKAKIKGVFKGLLCYYSNPLLQENSNNLLTNDWAFDSYHNYNSNC